MDIIMIHTGNTANNAINTVTSGYHWLPSQLNTSQGVTNLGNPVTKIPKHTHFSRAHVPRVCARACARAYRSMILVTWLPTYFYVVSIYYI